MPNIKSAKKRVLITKVRNERNKAVKTALRTQIKKLDALIATGGDSKNTFVDTVSSIDKAVAKGVLHKNTAARKKSQLAKKLNAAL